MEWNEEKAQEIVNKHKSRFSFRLTFKIIRVVAAVLFLFFLYTLILSIGYHMSGIGERNAFIQKLAIDWTEPEYTSDVSLSRGPYEITPFFTQKISIPIARRIGKENYVVAEATLTKRLITAFSYLEMESTYPYNSNKDRFSFSLPYHPITGEKLEGYQSHGVWETLEMVHEGYVADFAFSTEGYYTPEELLALLAPYDVEVLWMPIYMGEYETFEEHGYSSSGNDMWLAQPWGLSGEREASENYRSGMTATVITERSQEVMLKNMDHLLNNHKRVAEQILDTRHLQERYDYLMEHGFQVYGAVVTGPVKELLKLQEQEGIHSFYLGELKPWNWVK